MKIISVNSWDEFEEKIDELNREWSIIRQSTPLKVSDLLYRGQSNAEWPLKTTLERYTNKASFTLYEYFRIIHAAKYRIETFTDKKWPIPSLQKYYEWLKSYDPCEISKFIAYEYMAYLRHHSFPSPLLDWTASPFIAAFFAFRDLLSNAESVAVYAYVEYTGDGKSAKYSEPYIKTLGSYIRSHKRHFLQQSQYTLCIANDENELYRYDSHETAFNRNREDQDLLRKFIIPASERTKALKKLDAYNINAHSLLGSEESLMETIALREFILRHESL